MLYIIYMLAQTNTVSVQAIYIAIKKIIIEVYHCKKLIMQFAKLQIEVLMTWFVNIFSLNRNLPKKVQE